MSPPARLHRRTVLEGAGALGVAALAGRPVAAQSENPEPSIPADPDDLETFVDGLMAAHLEAHDVAGATVSVVGGGETLLAKGYGYADVAARYPSAPRRPCSGSDPSRSCSAGPA
ncbi:hypothetical protein [Halalkalicoccus salilacus]|uniref:hypothetical protein n=1 Tax=Halalkalicoccus sp. GCM10025704 TaxID=3252662 RepID=UPI003608C220